MVETDATGLESVLHALDAVLDHADQNLPISSEKDGIEPYLQALGQLASVYRADDVYRLLRKRDSALLAGALTRSLVESAVLDRWASSREFEEKPFEATLAQERSRIAHEVQRRSSLSVPTLKRWNNPTTYPELAMAIPGRSFPNVQSFKISVIEY